MNSIKFNNLSTLDYSRHEALNSLRTNIMFGGENIKTVMLTSCEPNDGKSILCFDLARSYAENDNKVLLLDLDLRNSHTLERFNVDFCGNKIYGIEHILSGMLSPDEVICETNIPNMDIAFTGTHVANPTGLLEGDRLKEFLGEMKDRYNLIVLDTPPVGTVIDAAIIGPLTDGVIFVTRHDRTRRRDLVSAVDQLTRGDCNIIGAVINAVPKSKEGYYYYKYE